MLDFAVALARVASRLYPSRSAASPAAPVSHSLTRRRSTTVLWGCWLWWFGHLEASWFYSRVWDVCRPFWQAELLERLLKRSFGDGACGAPASARAATAARAAAVGRAAAAAASPRAL